MNNYIEFKREYVRLLVEMLKQPVGTGAIIGTPRSREISSELADMEEMHPAWAHRVEDWLADQHQLQ